MPTYDYICKACGHEMEVFQRMTEAVLVDCPACEQPSLRRKIGTGAGLIFKGSGFYETDFKDRKGDKPKDSDGSGAKGADATADGAPAAAAGPAGKAADKAVEKSAAKPAAASPAAGTASA